jgi:hypothetical protein
MLYTVRCYAEEKNILALQPCMGMWIIHYSIRD